MKTAIEIPAVRDALALEKTSAGGALAYVVRDLETGQSIHMDALGAALVADLDRPRPLTALRRALEKRFRRELGPLLLRQRLDMLTRNYLLRGPRASRFVELASASRERSRDSRDALPFAFRAGLKHACQASGGCCSGTDVGPLSAEVVRPLEERDWGERVPARAEGVPLFRTGSFGGETIWLTGSHEGACVFLNDDKLCQVHAELGAEAKPAICRQFPYLFTRTPDGELAVSIQMECRSYLRAKAAAGPTPEIEGDLRALVESGAFVQEVREPLELARGCPVSWTEYKELEEALFHAFDGAESASAGAEAARQVLRGVVGVQEAVFAAEEPHLEVGRWSSAWPDVSFEGPARPERLRRLLVALLEATRSSQTEYEEAGDRVRAGMHARFGEAIQLAFVEAIDPGRWRDRDGALEEVSRDVWRAAVFAKQPLAQAHLAAGMGLLHLELALVAASAAGRAREAARVEIVEQDAVDSMVGVNKILRQHSIAGVLRLRPEDLSRSFILDRSPEGQGA